MRFYPLHDLERPENRANLIGSFWSELYSGRDAVDGYVSARILAERQVLQDLMESITSVSVRKIPVTHTEWWYPIRIQRDQIVPWPTTADEDDGNTVGSGVVLDSQGRDRLYAWYLPEEVKLQRAALIQDALDEPGVVWSWGTDFDVDLDNRVLLFAEDPFNHFPARAGGQDDDEDTVVLWLYHAVFEDDRMRDRYAELVTGGRSNPTATFRSILLSLVRGTLSGTRGEDIQAFLAGMIGSRLASVDGEKVLWTTEDSERKVVLTDYNAYILPKSASLLVSEGDVLTKGQALASTVSVHVPTPSDPLPDQGLAAVTVGPRWIQDGRIRGPLVFPNQYVDVLVDKDEDGLTKVSWQLGGHPDDVEAFWEIVHERGKSQGKTLARLLDLRDGDPESEPWPPYLPSRINPAEFLVKNLIGFNLIFILFDLNGADPERSNLGWLRYLQHLLPPQTTFIAVVSLSSMGDSTVGTDQVESLGSYTAAPTIGTSSAAEDMDEVIA